MPVAYVRIQPGAVVTALRSIATLPCHSTARELETISEQAFAEIISRNYLERAWLMRWLALIPRYIEWQRTREEEGWSWHAAEVAREVTIETPAGRRFIVRGRLDRVDVNRAGRFAVIDYKTQRLQSLRQGCEIALQHQHVA